MSIDAIVEALGEEISRIERHSLCSRSPDYWNGEIAGLRKAIKIIKEDCDGKGQDESV